LDECIIYDTSKKILYEMHMFFVRTDG